MNLLNLFKEFIAAEKLFHQKDQLLIAVSGGLDSVVLCELCKQGGFDFSIAHCNFQLRAAESERDEHFVKELAEKYKVSFFVKKFDTNTYADNKKISIQEAARNLRYEWFQELIPGLRLNQKPVWLLTAHHADDNVETQLMNFFKGTGIQGLRGIESKRSFIVRPLLFASRNQLVEFANVHKLPWVEDSSNQMDKYTRNYFRHHLIPLVENILPGAGENLKNNLSRFRDVFLLYQQAISLHKKKLLVPKGNEVHISILKLMHTTPLNTVLYEIIAPYGFTSKQTNEVVKLLNSESGREVYSSNHRIIKNRNWLIIAPLQDKDSQVIIIENENSIVDFENGRLSLKILQDAVPDSSANTAHLDARHIHFPLILRKWKTGDYFYPLGMKKKKKISRFLIDQKVSKTGKEKIWVIEMNKKIIWVVGLRIDERFKIAPQPHQTLRLSLSE
ncbi:MAG: tRNA lysidine(34) synthetase TilS [Chitinophagaceae bacterium]|jgi:tRNA(Ile)-lysidine synthase|nr:tRNA lysidine(34) synthetase TilS [Chitinophagaceae bacterium]